MDRPSNQRYIEIDDEKSSPSSQQSPQSLLGALWDMNTKGPEAKAANYKLLSALGLFAGGIAFLRLAGDLITPTFT